MVDVTIVVVGGGGGVDAVALAGLGDAAVVVVVVVAEVGDGFSSRDFLGLKLDKREKFKRRDSGSG